MTYRQMNTVSADTITENYGENIPAQKLLKDELTVLNALADQFDEINKQSTTVEAHGQPVMDIVSQWVRIKELKANSPAEEIMVVVETNKELSKNTLARLKNSSMPIPLYEGGQSLMDQVGTALGALIKRPAPEVVTAPEVTPAPEAKL